MRIFWKENCKNAESSPIGLRRLRS